MIQAITLQRYIYSIPMLLIWGFTLFIALTAYQDFLLGGNSWKQGDWLINSIEITIRRGMMGSMLLKVAQGLSIDVLLLVVVVQVGLLLATVGLTTVALKRKCSPSTLWLLILSPGFFIGFWALDSQGGLRKELISFFAFALMLFAASQHTPNKFLIYFSAVVFGFATISHEGNLFFAPFFAFCFWLARSRLVISRLDFVALLGIIGSACLIAVLIAFAVGELTDYMAVCQPILNAGVSAEMCEGAIKALEIPLSEYMTATFWVLFSSKIFSFALLYALTAVSILVIGSYLIGGRIFVRAYIASAFLFLPLYVVALDWGRWVSWHTTAVVFTLLIAISFGVQKRANAQEMPIRMFSVLLVFNVVWGFSHFVDVIWGGIAWKTLKSTFILLGLDHVALPAT
ncbi:hypothetical protein [Ruegeria profundi]|uniref:hypothetical protein n=1 Tax=Ruegeria profundi TaxID=1685378 RepID=UPI003C7A0973